ncbi:MAG: glycosyltransferase [Patescibacteria group bacterium]
MKVYYITHLRYPTEKAHGWQIAKMCDAFAELGHEVTLVVPDRPTPIQTPPEQYYQLRHSFAVKRLPIFDALARPWIPRLFAYLLTEWLFIRAVQRWQKTIPVEQACVMTRDPYLAPTLARPDWKVVFELHDVNPKFFWLHRTIAKAVDLIVTTNAWKRDELLRRWGTRIKGRVVALPNAIDLAPYQSLPPKEEAKRQLGWDAELRHVLYMGHLYDWKGVFVLADASAFLPLDVRVMMLGGTPEDAEKMRRYVQEHRLDRVTLLAHVPPERVPLHLAAADVLVLPNSGKSWYSKYTVSPLKLWDYLAAKRPVVVSDLPSLRELVTDEEVRFVRPDDPQALAEGVETALAGDVARVTHAGERVQRQTWTARASAIFASL